VVTEEKSFPSMTPLTVQPGTSYQMVEFPC
jgi:hypothetical protein